MTEAGLRAPAGARMKDAVEAAATAARPPQPLVALQRAAGNQAVAGMLQRTDAFALAASGPAAFVPRKGEMEAAFGTRFDDVRAHLGGPEAQAGLEALGAHAAARGTEVAFRERDPAPDLVAHELSHVVQQRRGGGAPGAASERAAEGAGAAVAAGGPVPDVGAVGAGAIQLAPVTTAGGTWDTTKYIAKDVGADIELEFRAADPVYAEQIGLVQTVKTECTKDGKRVPEFNDRHNEALSRPDDPKLPPGAAIDQKQKDYLKTNPLYANQGGTEPKQLTDGPTSPGFGRHGFRRPVEVGPVHEQPAQLKDNPDRSLEFPEQEWKQTFEVAALALDGPFKDVYLGSVAWGWERRWDPERRRGVSQASPFPIAVVRHGNPSSDFVAAAERWNRYQLSDGTFERGRHDTVDLPIAEDPRKLSTADLAAKLVAARDEAAAASGPAQGPKRLTATELERELMHRNLKVVVSVEATQDAAGDDDVYVTVTGGKAPHKTAVQSVAEKRAGTFLVPVHAFAADVPFTGRLTIAAWDENVIADDCMATVTWDGSGTPAGEGSAGGGKYHVTVAYER